MTYNMPMKISRIVIETAQNRSSGFTLIELLVVITIIGVLASVVLAALDDARASARDSKRVSEVRQLQTALEMYANLNDQKYPCRDGTTTATNCTTIASLNRPLPASFETGLQAALDIYFAPDPLSSVGTIRYRLARNADSASSQAADAVFNAYRILVYFEKPRTNSAGRTTLPPQPCKVSVGEGYPTYAVYEDCF